MSVFDLRLYVAELQDSCKRTWHARVSAEPLYALSLVVDLRAVIFILCTIRKRSRYTQLGSELALSSLRLVTHLVCIVGIPIFVTHCLLKYVAPCYKKLYFSFIECVKQTGTKQTKKKETVCYKYSGSQKTVQVKMNGL